VLWRVQLVALGDGDAEVIRVSTTGDPGVGQGEMVAVDGLTAQAYDFEGKTGVAFRCQAIRSSSARSAGSEKAAA
jgi:hypothetical protein